MEGMAEKDWWCPSPLSASDHHCRLPCSLPVSFEGLSISRVSVSPSGHLLVWPTDGCTVPYLVDGLIYHHDSRGLQVRRTMVETKGTGQEREGHGCWAAPVARKLESCHVMTLTTTLLLPPLQATSSPPDVSLRQLQATPARAPSSLPVSGFQSQANTSPSSSSSALYLSRSDLHYQRVHPWSPSAPTPMAVHDLPRPAASPITDVSQVGTTCDMLLHARLSRSSPSDRHSRKGGMPITCPRGTQLYEAWPS